MPLELEIAGMNTVQDRNEEQSVQVFASAFERELTNPTKNPYIVGACYVKGWIVYLAECTFINISLK